MVSRPSLSKIADAVVSAAGFIQPPICPRLIAAKHDIFVMPVTQTPGGAAGAFVTYDGMFAIVYREGLASDAFQRFTIAHELGHYFIDGHCEIGPVREHGSRSNGQRYAQQEREAEYFASCLLMPEAMVRSVLAGSNRVGLAAVQHLSMTFRTSLTAAAFRHVETTTDRVGVVLAEDGVAIAARFSKQFIKSFDLTDSPWLKGLPVPAGRALHGLAVNPPASRTLTLREWSPSLPAIPLVEDVAMLGETGRALLVYTTPTEEPRSVKGD